MKITSLVTGGAGFIGSHLVNHLIDDGHEVVVLDNLSGGQNETIHPNVSLVVGSITDAEFVNQLFQKHDFTYVFHLAAYAAEGLSPFIRKFNYETNLIGSINLINASVNHRIKCFVFTSSIAVNGNNEPPVSEDTQPNPIDPYGIAKYATELDLYNAHEMFGLDFIIFRPHNVYGPNQNIMYKYRNVVGIFMHQILSGQPLTIFGDGSQKRAFTYIDDVAPYIAKAVSTPEAFNQVIHIGSNQVHTVKELAVKVSHAMGSELNFINLKERKEVSEVYSNPAKFEAIFKPDSYTNLDTGLTRMADWVKQQSKTSENVKNFKEIEIYKNLPESWK